MSHQVCGFEHLHLHTSFSLLDGCGNVSEYAEQAPKINQRFLCITDHGMMGAVPSQIKACEENGISPIMGCELYIHPNQPEIGIGMKMADYVSDLPELERKKMRKSYHLTAIAYTTEGYENLVQLTSWGWLHGFYYKPRVSHAMLMKHKEGIIFLSGCYNGEIGQAFDNAEGRELRDEGTDEDAAMAMVEKYMAMFGANFYLEIMLLDFHKQRPYDIFLQKVHAKYGIPMVVTQDCFVEGTWVTTNLGLKKIEDINVGDEVWTHKSRFRKVEYINSRKLKTDEIVYRVKCRLGSYAFEATGNHPVQVAQMGGSKAHPKIIGTDWKKVEDLLKSDYLIVPKVDKSIFGNINYIDIFDIIGNDFPRLSGSIGRAGNNSSAAYYDEQEECLISYRGWDKRNIVKIPRRISIDDDFLRVLGLYLAEGAVDKNVVYFGFHKNETNLCNFVKEYFSRFGIHTNKTFVSEHGVKIKFSSVLFSKLFPALCGNGSHNKHLPKADGKLWSEKQTVAVLLAYFEGDARKYSNGDYLPTSVSERLIYEISEVLNACGVICLPQYQNLVGKTHWNPNANVAAWHTPYTLHVSLAKLKKIFGGTERVRGPYFENDNYWAIKVRNVFPILYDKSVYNLQVAEDESYTANFFGVHNCHYCKQEDSLLQRNMLMIQTQKTIADLEEAKSQNTDLFELQDTNLWQKSEDELNQFWEAKFTKDVDYDLFMQAKANTVVVCERAKGVELDRSIKLPKLPHENDVLWEETLKGFKRRGLPSTKEYGDRIREEYDLICDKEFASYFLIEKMMTDEARRKGPEILGFGDGSEVVGPGRGSACGSLLCYCLGITDVNPIPHNLLFSRFLSPARGGKSMKVRFSKEPIVGAVAIEKEEEASQGPLPVRVDFTSEEIARVWQAAKEREGKRAGRQGNLDAHNLDDIAVGILGEFACDKLGLGSMDWATYDGLGDSVQHDLFKDGKGIAHVKSKRPDKLGWLLAKDEFFKTRTGEPIYWCNSKIQETAGFVNVLGFTLCEEVLPIIKLPYDFKLQGHKDGIFKKDLIHLLKEIAPF